MKVLVLGATGGTGLQIVLEASRNGHSVVALVRSRLRKPQPDAMQLVEGDARDETVLARAMEGCGAVISSLGTPISLFQEVDVLSTATRALVKVMNEMNVRRLVCITGMGAGDSRGHGGFLYDRLILPLVLRKVYEDKDRQEQIVQESDLDWILVRPTILNDRRRRGHIRALTDLDLSRIRGGSISRADVAKFVVEQLTSDVWLHRTPLITN